MKTLINRDVCPICQRGAFTPFLNAVDYTVSKSTFSIVKCDNCDFHFTNPIPVIDEIGEYYKSESYVSHSSTNKGLINKLYQTVRKRTLKKKVKLVQQVAKGNQLLDIGAGTGHFIDACQQAGLQPLGLEPDEDARNFATTNFDVAIEPIEELYQLAEKSKDVITMWHVLEHVYNLREDIAQIERVLKDDGTLIVAVPNRNSYDAKKYKEFWAAYDLPIHLYHFTPNDIRRLFDQFQMEVKEVLPMKYDSFYVSMLSEKYKGGNLPNAFLTGLRSNIKADGESYSSQIYILQKKAR